MVLVMLAMMAALGVTGLNNYIDHAKQTARDSVARTIFMAAQTSLTHKYNQDRDFYINDRSPILPPGNFLPEGEAEKLSHNPPALVYLKMDKGANNRDLPLYKMLSPYLNDKSILNDSILIEFNRETGKMLSVFYSEMDGVTLSYGAGGSYDVRNRGEAALVEGEVGFFGVDSTGEVVRPDPIDVRMYSVRLTDHVSPQEQGAYGLLTADIQIDAAEMTPGSARHYQLELLPALGRTESLHFAYNDAPEYDFSIQSLIDEGILTAEAAIAHPRVIAGANAGDPSRRIPVYYTTGGGRYTISVILDGVLPLGSAESIGIRENFPKIEGGLLFGELVINDGLGNWESVYSDDDGGTPVHALYGADSSADNSRLTVMSVRHLNNIRYSTAANASFVQTQSVYMWDTNGEPFNFTPLCNRFDTANPGDTHGFRGTYTSSAAYAIYDFRCDLTLQNDVAGSISDREGENDPALYDAGLFDTVLSGARVEDVRFALSDPTVLDTPRRLLVTSFGDNDDELAEDAVAMVKGIRSAGGIAANNQGTIDGCTMLGFVGARFDDGVGDGAAGGIAGINSGTLNNCASACSVYAERYAGGIAGTSSGTISRCEAGTASWRSATDASHLYLTGTPQFGAADGPNGVYAGGTHTANNTYRVKIEMDDGVSGGIAGRVSGTDAQVTGCVNACKIEAGNEIDGQGAHTGGIAGGIVGALDAASSGAQTMHVGWCYNAGAVYATYSAGGVVGEVTRGGVAYCYNTGYVNWEREMLNIYENDGLYYLPGISRNLGGNPPHRAGGLLGSGSDATVISNCYSMQYTGDGYGGAFGILHKDASVYNCLFLRNVLNTTDDYYVATNRLMSQESLISSGLHMRGVENMRKAPSPGDLDAYFAEGNFISPFGVFKFKFPYLTASPDGPLPGHRTPWNPTIERYGDISLTGTMREESDIICTFYLAPPEGYIYLRSGNYGASPTNLIACIPLYNQPDFNSLTDLRNEPGEWHDIYGFEANYDPVPGTEETYTFEARADKLNPLDPSESKLIAAGFTYRYQIKMVYGEPSPDYKYTRVSSVDNTAIAAELYNIRKTGESQYVKTARIGDCTLTLLNPSTTGDITSCVLRVSGATFDNGKRLRLEFGGASHAIEFDDSLVAAAPDSFKHALESNKRVTFTGSAPTLQFPYYVEPDADGTKSVCLVLWAEGSGVSYGHVPPPPTPPTRAELESEIPIPSGGSVTLTAQRVRASVPKTIAERKIYEWSVLG